MGNFLDDINKAKTEHQNKQNTVVNEIVCYFQKQLADPGFEERLKNRIIENIKGNYKTILHIEYWKHHDGCSPTHYEMSFCKDFYGNGGYNHNYYNDVDLWEIRYDVVSKLCELLNDKLNSLGLRYSKECKTGWLDYPEYDYEIIV